MTASEIHIEFRRRLPSAPELTNGDLNGVSGEVRRRRSLEFLRRQTMDVVPKKRLTPEVVATLLSTDFPDGSGPVSYRNNVVCNINPVKSGKDMFTTGECVRLSNSKGECMRLSNKVSSKDNTGIVQIVKTSGQPLGFSLREYNGSNTEKPGGIFVSRLTVGGVVEQHSLFSAGDEILEINNVPVHDYKLSDVVAMIQIPKKLLLKVRFRQNSHRNSAGVYTDLKEKPILGINNNYIYDNISETPSQNQCAHNQSIRATESGSLLEQEKKCSNTECIPAADAFRFRRTSECSSRSSGRILPAKPELGIASIPNNFERSSKPLPRTCSNDPQRTEPKDVQDTSIKLLNQKSECSTFSQVTNRNFKKSTMLPLSTSEGRKHSEMKGKRHSQAEGRQNGSEETNYDVPIKRVDPVDIKVDILTINGAHSNVSKSSPTLEDKVDDNRDFIPVCSLLSLRNNSNQETFGSSSSLSSSDSPKNRCRRQIEAKTSRRVSSPEMRLRSMCPSDGSPVSSSAESEDQSSKNASSDKTKRNAEQKPPLLSHSFLFDELNQSHNSWFSKIGNQKRKHARKLSEAEHLWAPKGAEAYRIQELSDPSNDGIDPGYRLYPVRNENRGVPRAITGMLTLNVVKISRILPNEAISKDKQKKVKVFCTVDADGIRQACTVSKKVLNNIQWNESFEIVFQRTREMKITVWTHSKKAGDETLSESCLCLAQLLNEGSEHNLAVGLEPCGTLYVKLQFTDIKLLLQRTPSQKKGGVFGFPLETVLRRENSRIPTIVKKCVEEINLRGLDVTGIYRLCGNAAKKRALRAQFENCSANVELGQTENPVDINVITGLLKDFLRELPEPLLSEEVREILYEASTGTRCESNDQFLVEQIITKFSATSRDTVVYLLDHFATVLMNSDLNKMDSHNLAVCIGPVLLCPSLGTVSINLVGDTKKDINAIKLLLELWPRPEQVSAC